jgi:hypothetical protein
MNPDHSHFEVSLRGAVLKVEKHNISGQVVYRVVFPDKRPDLFVHRALDANASRFWTSIPEGRQPEAREIGPLISEFFKSTP